MVIHCSIIVTHCKVCIMQSPVNLLPQELHSCPCTTIKVTMLMTAEEWLHYGIWSKLQWSLNATKINYNTVHNPRATHCMGISRLGGERHQRCLPFTSCLKLPHSYIIIIIHAVILLAIQQEPPTYLTLASQNTGASARLRAPQSMRWCY